MFFASQRLPVSWPSICTAFAGAVYCAFQALPSIIPASLDIPCPGSGCQLFQDFTIYGISLWWAGVAYFTFVMLLCLRKAHGFALFTATAALLADSVLLIIMLGTASCVACLGAAALMGLFFLVLRRHVTARVMPAPGPSYVFLAWAGLFIAVLASAGTELIQPFSLAENGSKERRVYFSPSCPACRDAITVFGDKAIFIPVVEKDSDYAAIRVMRNELKKGSSMVDALRASDSAREEPFSFETAIFRLKLLRNKAEVLRLGFDRLPLIMLNGMPENMRSRNADPVSHTSDPSALPPELSVLNSCGDRTQEPCDPPLTPRQ